MRQGADGETRNHTTNEEIYYIVNEPSGKVGNINKKYDSLVAVAAV